MAVIQLQAGYLRPDDFDFASKRKLGSGSVACVYAVKYLKCDGREVAVKRPNWVDSAWTKEIDILVNIAHKNIVRLFGTVCFESRICLVMELAPRGSVADFLKDEARDDKMELLRAWRLAWLTDVARAVKYLHFEAPEPLVHGDLKGCNVLIFDCLDGTTVAKVADFGNSRPLQVTSAVDKQGTLLWTAPEVLAKECHSPKSDVWSFGCTTVELLSEREPYYHHLPPPPDDESHYFEVLNKIKKRQLDPLSELPIAAWPPKLVQVVRRCFQPKHEDRPSMDAVLYDLTAAQPKKQLHISSHSLSGAPRDETVSLSAVATCSAIPGAPRCVCVSGEGEFSGGGKRRRWVVCRHVDSGEFLNISLLDGRSVNSASELFIRRFLRASSALPSCPTRRHAPHVDVFCEAELLRMVDRSMEAAPREALWEEGFAAQLSGVRCGEQLFWSVSGFAMFAGPSGQVLSREKIPGDGHFFFLLLRDGDQLPAACMPRGERLEVLHRLGAGVRVEKGLLVVTRAPSPADLERWVFCARDSELREMVTAAAARK